MTLLSSQLEALDEEEHKLKAEWLLNDEKNEKLLRNKTHKEMLTRLLYGDEAGEFSQSLSSFLFTKFIQQVVVLLVSHYHILLKLAVSF